MPSNNKRVAKQLQKKQEREQPPINSDSDLFSDGDDQEIAEMEKEAKYMQDDYESSEAEMSEEDENSKFLADGHDLDLPENDTSEEEQDDSDSDRELEEYYQELGIKMDKKQDKGLYK